MKTVRKVSEMRSIIREVKKEGKSIGLVPTMGYFHEGHLSLIREAGKECDILIVSIFVNPTQFGPSEDYEHYPRDLGRDELIAEREEVDFIFAVAKLFNLVQPDTAYFGQKDAQQAAIIKKMVSDLDMDVEIHICPIVREKDGLAMSSRNAYLNEEERKAAPVLHRAVLKAKDEIIKGKKNAGEIRKEITEIIEGEKLARIDYIAIVDPENLQEVDNIEEEVLIAVAVWIGKTRLIDNIIARKSTSSMTL